MQNKQNLMQYITQCIDTNFKYDKCIEKVFENFYFIEKSKDFLKHCENDLKYKNINEIIAKIQQTKKNYFITKINGNITLISKNEYVLQNWENLYDENMNLINPNIKTNKMTIDELNKIIIIKNLYQYEKKIPYYNGLQYLSFIIDDVNSELQSKVPLELLIKNYNKKLNILENIENYKMKKYKIAKN